MGQHKLRGFASAVLRHENKEYNFVVRDSNSETKMVSASTLKTLAKHAGFKLGNSLRFFLCDETSVVDGVIWFEVC